MNEDMKTYAINLTALAVSFTEIDMALKLMLLVTTIGFTAQKWYLLNQERKEKKANK